MTYAVVFVLAYLLGSIPFGVVITRALGLGDLRAIGSGNIGATNVLRTGNKRAAALTLALDAAKGAVAVLVARAVLADPLAAALAGLGAFLGHLFPVWLRFRGGKGVATFLGLLLALAPPVGLIACATWLAAAFAFRVSSLSALIAAGTAPIWLWAIGPVEHVWLGVVLALLILARHHANIRRLAAGTEPRIGAGKG
jgi:acyl phosphate:glycerol-3-phosphate acyltransferase